MALGIVALLVVILLGLYVGIVLVLGFSGAPKEISIASVVFLFLVPACYFSGRWGGYRCRERGVIAVVLTIVTSLLLVWVLALSIMGFEEYARFLDRIDASLSLFVVPVVFLVGIGLLGYWRGNRTRASHYLHYLVRLLPKDTSDALLDLAYTEAVRLRGS